MFVTERWRAVDIAFYTTLEYETDQQFEVLVMGEFTHNETGTKITLPAFWNGENEFVLRFAPTKTGEWSVITKCDTDASLDGIAFNVTAKEYEGDLDIYKHGFVKTVHGTKYFMYDDGTPFFYLGDTHWNFLEEEFDSAGDHAAGIKTDSHFKYIIEKRIQQGFTVYQTEPIRAPFNVIDGFSSKDVEGFKIADKYFKYIADRGLLHPHGQHCFAQEIWPIANDDEYLEKITRYWVARYAAYPVLWTLAQEIDTYTQPNVTVENDPWVKVAEYIHKYDGYQHPLTAHQRGVSKCNVTGRGTGIDYRWGDREPYNRRFEVPNGGRSIYYPNDITKKTGHSWWASQWSLIEDRQMEDIQIKDYWESPKVAIQYESCYDHLWTLEFGARAQAWGAWLTGFYGNAYGAQDIWLYKSDYEKGKSSFDNYDVEITAEHKNIVWGEAIELPSGYQMGYLKEFFQRLQWWKLVPDFNTEKHFRADIGQLDELKRGDGCFYQCATDGNNTYVLYFHNLNSLKAGTLKDMDKNATYTVNWYDPRNNKYILIGDSISPDENGEYHILEKPDTEDWVVLAQKN